MANLTPVLMELEHPAWERQPGEAAVAYSAFRAYRDLGEGRTIEKAAAVLVEHWPDIPGKDSRSRPRGRNGLKNYVNHAKHWSARYRWVERASEWDAYIDRHRLAAEDEGMKRMARHYEARAETIREMEWEIAKGGFDALKQFLQAPPLGEVRKVVTKGGQQVEEIHYHPNPNFTKVLPGVMREASRMARISIGLPTEGSRMPTQPLDTGADTDVKVFLDSLGGDHEDSPSALLSDPGEPS